ncbi:MAG: GAF domain-containing protein, partial [Actinomycetaceae bacterium]|nr:GAF domain-containing protein [Actinomycetaceae bacterium]
MKHRQDSLPVQRNTTSLTDDSDIMDVVSYALELTTRLDQNSILQSLADSARNLTGAKYSALGVADSHGKTLQFVFSGVPQNYADTIKESPLGEKMISSIPANELLLVNDVEGFPYRSELSLLHPDLTNFLGVPIRAHGRILGRIYLSNKENGFTEQDTRNISLLGQAAAIAVENARLFEESNRRAQWIAASRSITATLLEKADDEESLELISHEMRRVAHADVSLLVLPSIGNTWVCEIATGEDSFQYIGLTFPEDSYVQMAIREGNGMVTDNTDTLNSHTIPELSHFGPALY